MRIVTRLYLILFRLVEIIVNIFSNKRRVRDWNILRYHDGTMYIRLLDGKDESTIQFFCDTIRGTEQTAIKYHGYSYVQIPNRIHVTTKQDIPDE